MSDDAFREAMIDLAQQIPPEVRDRLTPAVVARLSLYFATVNGEGVGAENEAVVEGDLRHRFFEHPGELEFAQATLYCVALVNDADLLVAVEVAEQQLREDAAG